MTEQQFPSMPSVVIFGAASEIARAMADEFARKGYALALAGRNTGELEVIADDLRIRHQRPCHVLPFDAEDLESHAGLVDTCTAAFGALPDGVVVCFGFLPDQAAAQRDFALAKKCLDVNHTGAMSVLERFAAEMEARRWGFLAAVSSVAGDRGRKSNYHYGAAKAALTTYLEGLRHRLHASGVRVTTLKPGFVDTRMTFGMKVPAPLLTSAEKAGRLCVRAILRGRGTAYVPEYWRLILLLIRHLPEFIFKKTNL